MLTIICDKPCKQSAVEREKTKRHDGEVTLRLRCTRTWSTDLHIFSVNQPDLFYPRAMGRKVA